MTDQVQTDQTPPLNLRSGIVAVVGRASTGKSTLMNALLGEKVTIVSPIPQTTRAIVRGILTEARGQIVFLDTPGIHRSKNDLGRTMNRRARAAAEGADAVLLVLDAASHPFQEDEGWMRRLLFSPCPIVMALNKCDRSPLHADDYVTLWRRIEQEKHAAKPVDWIRISALQGDGLSDLIALLFERLPIGPQLFPEDILTDYPRKLAIADIVREKYNEVLRDELPHALAVEIEDIKEEQGAWTADGLVIVEKPSQKGIVIGAKGRLLKQVCERAEGELSEMYGRPIRLDLHVKVYPKWTRNHWMLKRLGYVT
jgi:GTP-binding protein Era